MAAPRVLLVDMPFASVGHPSLGLGMLQATLREAGVDCDALYANVAFAREIGVAGYERIALDLPDTILAGEWAFTASLYDAGQRPADTYVEDVLVDRWRLSREDIDLILGARRAASGFLERCMESVAWGDYDLVGFTSTCAQNSAALALAKRVKERHPRAPVVFGGTNWDESMGVELHRRFPFVDFAVSGEAEESLPALVGWLANPTSAGLSRIPGVSHRRAGRTTTTVPASPVADLEGLPPPDYDDYFEALKVSGLTRRVRPAVNAETCRGCWWASRHPCRFCGSPGCRRVYRAKSPGKVLRELRELAGRHACRSLTIVDDVPSPEFFDQVLPELARHPLPVPVFCEVRPEVTHDQIRMLSQARASVQPGIESLDDHVLRLMRKGSRALENVRLLLWCRRHGVTPTWNVIYGIPGEEASAYGRMLDWVPAIRFLEPPDGCGPVRLDRFSVYASKPGRFGWHNVRPLHAYSYIYPFPKGSLRRIVYAFEYDWEPSRDPLHYVGPMLSAVRRWQEGPERGEPRFVAGHGGAIIVDTRSDAPRVRRRLDALEAAVYEGCADISSRQALERLLAVALPDEPQRTERADDALASFVADRLMVRDGDRYLSLALPDDGRGQGAASVV